MKKKIIKVRKICKNKAIIITLIIVILIIILAFILGKKDSRFTLNSIYDVVPAEVRELYFNTVDVSCIGDLYLGIGRDSGDVLIENINYEYMINYMFSYLDKNDKLDETVTTDKLDKTIEKLFSKKLNLVDYIKNFSYDGYVFNVKDGGLVREKSECKSDIKYVSRLYGYSVGEHILSMDINIGYLKNGILYDIEDNQLGEYDGKDLTKLDELFKMVPYYRYNYIKDGSDFKLKSVKLNTRSKLER